MAQGKSLTPEEKKAIVALRHKIKNKYPAGRKPSVPVQN
jgi:hypothetical protein